MDTVDIHFTEEWLKNIAEALGGRKPDYLVIQHMEPDHSASIEAFLKVYPDTTVVATAKAFAMIGQFFDLDLEGRKLVAETALPCLWVPMNSTSSLHPWYTGQRL